MSSHIYLKYLALKEDHGDPGGDTMTAISKMHADGTPLDETGLFVTRGNVVFKLSEPSYPTKEFEVVSTVEHEAVLLNEAGNVVGRAPRRANIYRRRSAAYIAPTTNIVDRAIKEARETFSSAFRFAQRAKNDPKVPFQGALLGFYHRGIRAGVSRNVMLELTKNIGKLCPEVKSGRSQSVLNDYLARIAKADDGDQIAGEMNSEILELIEAMNALIPKERIVADQLEAVAKSLGTTVEALEHRGLIRDRETGELMDVDDEDLQRVYSQEIDRHSRMQHIRFAALEEAIADQVEEGERFDDGVRGSFGSSMPRYEEMIFNPSNVIQPAVDREFVHFVGAYNIHIQRRGSARTPQTYLCRRFEGTFDEVMRVKNRIPQQPFMKVKERIQNADGSYKVITESHPGYDVTVERIRDENDDPVMIAKTSLSRVSRRVRWSIRCQNPDCKHDHYALPNGNQQYLMDMTPGELIQLYATPDDWQYKRLPDGTVITYHDMKEYFRIQFGKTLIRHLAEITADQRCSKCGSEVRIHTPRHKMGDVETPEMVTCVDRPVYVPEIDHEKNTSLCGRHDAEVYGDCVLIHDADWLNRVCQTDEDGTTYTNQDIMSPLIHEVDTVNLSDRDAVEKVRNMINSESTPKQKRYLLSRLFARVDKANIDALDNSNYIAVVHDAFADVDHRSFPTLKAQMVKGLETLNDWRERQYCTAFLDSIERQLVERAAHLTIPVEGTTAIGYVSYSNPDDLVDAQKRLVVSADSITPQEYFMLAIEMVRREKEMMARARTTANINQWIAELVQYLEMPNDVLLEKDTKLRIRYIEGMLRLSSQGQQHVGLINEVYAAMGQAARSN